MAKRTVQDVLTHLKNAEKSFDTSSVVSTVGRAHRGVDITYSRTSTGKFSTGMHMHVPSSTTKDDIEKIKAEAYELGFKEAMTQMWDMLPNVGQTGILINTGDAIHLKDPDIDINGDRIIVQKSQIIPTTKSEDEPAIVTEAIKELEVGWYQDEKADLYYYEGEGHWKEVDLATNKKLTDDAILGKLEYIG